MQNERRIANTIGIYSLWLNWFVAVGSIVIVPILSLYLSKYILPLIVITIEVMMYFIIRYNKIAKRPSCLRLFHISMVSLFWSALLMLIINLINIIPLSGVLSNLKSHNNEIPYIPILIISPITVIVSIYNLIKGFNSNICVDCQARYGNISERGFLGKLYAQEGFVLTRMLLMLSLLFMISSWLYYFCFYISTNINAPDRFIFAWSQLIIFIITIIYLAIRYFSMWMYYYQNIDGSSLRYNSSSLVRYLIICGDYIYLKIPNINVDNITSDEGKIDTPARLYIQYKKSIDESEAVMFFNALSGIPNAKLKFLYQNKNFNTECNIFHYAYIIDKKSIIKDSRLEGEWYLLSEINELINRNKTSLILQSELNRIYKIVMVWKTYNNNGTRLYNIKNYKPTFRLNDINNWDVDFNDINWLFVSLNNEDKPFFKLRKFWNKYICGIGI